MNDAAARLRRGYSLRLSSNGELALSERMAPVNALLDVAPPALREALLIASWTGWRAPPRDDHRPRAHSVPDHRALHLSR